MKTNGSQTFLEHWGFVLVAFVAIIISQILDFFAGLSGAPWIGCYVTGLIVATAGASLIFYAKLPAYRQRRFMTFGSQPLPESSQPFYRWGYRCILFAITLLLSLFLSRP